MTFFEREHRTSTGMVDDCTEYEEPLSSSIVQFFKGIHSKLLHSNFDQTIQDWQHPKYLQANGYVSTPKLEVGHSRKWFCRSRRSSPPYPGNFMQSRAASDPEAVPSVSQTVTYLWYMCVISRQPVSLIGDHICVSQWCWLASRLQCLMRLLHLSTRSKTRALSNIVSTPSSQRPHTMYRQSQLQRVRSMPADTSTLTL